MTYEVESMEGCAVVRGLVPLDEAAALMRCWSERDGGWALDDVLTGLLDASFVAGPPAALRALRDKLGVHASQRS